MVDVGAMTASLVADEEGPQVLMERIWGGQQEKAVVRRKKRIKKQEKKFYELRKESKFTQND